MIWKKLFDHFIIAIAIIVFLSILDKIIIVKIPEIQYSSILLVFDSRQ